MLKNLQNSNLYWQCKKLSTEISVFPEKFFYIQPSKVKTNPKIGVYHTF